MSGLYNLLTSPLGLPIPAIWEWVIMAVIGVIAFKVAWEISDGGDSGAAVHWVVRIIVFFVLWAVTYGVIVAVRWLLKNWIITICVAAVLVVLGVTIWLIMRNKKKKDQETNERNERQRN